jgi:hypothetical protein
MEGSPVVLLQVVSGLVVADERGGGEYAGECRDGQADQR